ncbi:unnamed protein product [Lactuca saligna]|uniref:Uncharacterized protein n=1 Tax=Lactuca saligna TaxID=75948 RepID=A0AA35ZSP5_LACSI|nr:unnamed protein product [Lactuca saligna]
MALHGHYQGKLCHREIDLLEALPHPVSEKRMRELVGLPSVERGNSGSSGPASPSQPAVGVVSLIRSPVLAFSSLHARVQAEKDEENKSDDAGLHPRKVRRTVSVARLLSGIEGVLGGVYWAHLEDLSSRGSLPRLAN